MSRRDDLLKTFCQLILTEGERAATLDAVAANAGVSKGGLLYHFPSRVALVTGLRDRFLELVDADLDQLRADGQSPSRWYLETSVRYDSELERTMAALMRIAPTSEVEIRSALRTARSLWYEAVYAELGDAHLATAVILLGDGIAYSAELEGEINPDSQFVGQHEVDYLAKVIFALRSLRQE